MAFKNIMDNLVETEEEERARLAEAPAGSTTHALSLLPATVTGWPEGLVIELPRLPNADGTVPSAEENTIVVVPTEFRGDSEDATRESDGKRRRHFGWWNCTVVYSTHSSYPVGGYNLSISAAEISRGRQVDLAPLFTPAPAAEPAQS